MSIHQGPLVVAWKLWCLLLCCCFTPAAHATTTFDSLPAVGQHAQQLTNSHLIEALELYTEILFKHNIRKESPTLRDYVEQLRAVLQPDCCDYFTALPTVKGLTEALQGVLDLQLTASLRPVVRRSYLAAIWLLQRSKYFKWDSSLLHKAALAGMYNLYEGHLDAVAGRPISFHHISKTGGTTLCTVAWENGCRGPGMSKKDNCMLDTRADGPVWVLQHNVTTANNVTPVPREPAPAPGTMTPQQIRLQALTRRLIKTHTYDWFMYECPADRLVGRVGRPCSELQEGAVSKAATFFATENARPTEHGNPKVCDEFTNVVLVREAMSEAVSLMTEVSLVYTRLLKQQRVLGWQPPKWDLTWWQQWAPIVVSSYSTRTLLGTAAYCPTAVQPAGAMIAAQTIDSSHPSSSSSSRVMLSTNSTATTTSGSGVGGGPMLAPLSSEDVHRALQVLASFDAVLDLGSLQLMDASLAKVLGWSGQTYSAAQQRRLAQALYVPAWEHLELLARQQAPKPPPQAPPRGNGNIIVRQRPKRNTDVGRRPSTSPARQGHQGLHSSTTSAAAAAAGHGMSGTNSNVHDTAELDAVRRMIAEVHVRAVYSSVGLPHVLMPIAPQVPLPKVAPAAVAAAITALSNVRHSQLIVHNTSDGAGEWHLVVQLQLGRAGRGLNSKTANSAAVYHVWPRHGVVLTVEQYNQLLDSTAADAVLHRHGRTMQLLDVAWVSLLAEQRKVRKMLLAVQEEVQASCGFAGRNHLQ